MSGHHFSRVLITRYVEDQSCLLPGKSLLLYILVRKMQKKSFYFSTPSPPYEGSEICFKKKQYMPKHEIIGFWCLIAQMKRQNTLNSTQKTSTFSDVPLLKRSRKIQKNGNFWKNGHFWEFFLIFSATVKRTELRFFCVAISASWRFI